MTKTLWSKHTEMEAIIHYLCPLAHIKTTYVNPVDGHLDSTSAKSFKFCSNTIPLPRNAQI